MGETDPQIADSRADIREPAGPHHLCHGNRHTRLLLTELGPALPAMRAEAPVTDLGHGDPTLFRLTLH